MGLDPLSPIAPARVRCLLLPCGRITRSRFSSLVDRVQHEVTVRLGDVSPNAGQPRNMFSPLAFPTGLVIFDMSTASPTPSQLSLAPFELYREPLIILGIVDGLEHFQQGANEDQTSSTKDMNYMQEVEGKQNLSEVDHFSDSLAWLKETYTPALVHQILIFDALAPSASIPDSLVFIPPPEQSKKTNMKTVMCDLTSALLSEMTSYVKSLQALPSIETPVAHPADTVSEDRQARSSSTAEDSVRPSSRLSNTSTARSSSPAVDGNRNHRASLPAHLSSRVPPEGMNESNGSRSAANVSRTPPITFDEINNPTEQPPQSTFAEQGHQSSKDRVSVQGFGSGSIGERARNKAKARMGTVVGSMFLLAGRWPDAVRELAESASIAKASNDHVWHAKALDYILVCMLLFGWAGMDFDIPAICYPLGDRSSSVSGKSAKQASANATPDLGALKSPNTTNRLVSLRNLCNLLPDLVNNILHLYVRAATFTSDQIPQISFSESTIRFSKLLACIQVSRGVLTDGCLQSVVLGTPQPTIQSSSLPEQIEPFQTQAEVTATVFRAIPSPSMQKSVDLYDHISILAGVVSVLSILGCSRKKAFILRELTLLLLPALIQSRKDSAAELGLHPAASLSTFDISTGGSSMGGTLSQDSKLNDGIQSFLALACEIYGTTLDQPGKSYIQNLSNAYYGELDDYESISDTCDRAMIHSFKRSFGDWHLKVEILRLCINICEALPDLQGVVRFSSALLATTASGMAPGIGIEPTMFQIPIEDQARLMSNISRTVSVARQVGLPRIEGEYWDEFLVRDLEVLSPTPADLPVLRQKTELDVATQTSKEKKGGPFIYNPFAAKQGAAVKDLTLIHNEEAIISVSLQNLADIDLEIEWLRLDSNDSAVEGMVQNIVIFPHRIQTITLNAMTRRLGQVTINGCIAKIRGCRARRFALFKAPWKGRADTKMKQIGLSAANPVIDRPASVGSSSGQAQQPSTIKFPIPTALIANVIENQPLINLNTASLSQLTVMVLEGETKIFSITLENYSSTSIDFVLFSFTDSASDLLQSKLANKSLTPAEIYEAELRASTKETFRMIQPKNGDDVNIAPKGELRIEAEIYGKPGLTHGQVIITYAHFGVPRSEVGDRFYTRQLSIPLSITVHPALTLAHNDILPFTGDFAWRGNYRCNDSNKNKRSSPSREEGSKSTGKTSLHLPEFLKRLGRESQEVDNCLLYFDFRNVWLKPLSISLQVRENVTKEANQDEPWKRAYTVHDTVQTGSSCRVFVLLPRFGLKTSHAAIPSVSSANQRQFVLSASKISPETERANRQIFWYREEILKHLRATWEEPNSGRHGDIDLRNLRLTSHMVDAVKLEDFVIELVLRKGFDEGGDAGLQQVSRSAYRVHTESQLSLVARITNRLSHPIYPLVRLQPSVRDQPPHLALDLSKRLAYNGLLQRALPVLGAGEMQEASIGLVFLAAGEYDVGASVEETRVWKPVSGTELGLGKDKGADTGDVGTLGTEASGRRVWYGRDPLLIDVFDDAGLDTN